MGFGADFWAGSLGGDKAEEMAVVKPAPHWRSALAGARGYGAGWNFAHLV